MNVFRFAGGEEEEVWNLVRVWMSFEKACFEDGFKEDKDVVSCSVERGFICKGRLVVGNDSLSSMLFVFIILLSLTFDTPSKLKLSWFRRLCLFSKS